MNQQSENIQPQARTSLPSAQNSNDTEAQADTLLARAQSAQSEQASLLDASAIELRYSEMLAVFIDSKHEQAARVEDRLENLIERQASQLQQFRSQQPGLIALPGTRNTWQRHLQQQERTMQHLLGRLELVREIKDGMGLHGPRIEELASRKMRRTEPELANEWDELQEALRRHLALQRAKEKEQRHQHALATTVPGISNTLAISTRPKA